MIAASYNTSVSQLGVDSHHHDGTSSDSCLSIYRRRKHHDDDRNGTNMGPTNPSTRRPCRRRARSSSSYCFNLTAATSSSSSSPYSFCMLSTFLLMGLVLSLSPSSVVSAEYCNICPNAPGSVRSLTPIRDGSNLPNPTGIVQNYLTQGTTCTDLQVSVGDVLSSIAGGGNDLEAAHCAKTQFLACVSGCCHNDQGQGQGLSEPLGSGVCYTQNVHDPNPACDLCGGPTKRQFHFVPEPNIEKLTDTKYVGTHNCQGLYRAAAEGIFSSNFCPMIQQESGEDCCNL